MGIVTRLCVGWSGGSNPDIGKRFFSANSRPTLRPSQISIQWAPVFCAEVKAAGAES